MIREKKVNSMLKLSQFTQNTQNHYNSMQQDFTLKLLMYVVMYYVDCYIRVFILITG